jgi:hypothetical protein
MVIDDQYPKRRRHRRLPVGNAADTVVPQHQTGQHWDN